MSDLIDRAAALVPPAMQQFFEDELRGVKRIGGKTVGKPEVVDKERLERDQILFDEGRRFEQRAGGEALDEFEKVSEKDAEIKRLEDQLHHMKVEYQDEDGISEWKIQAQEWEKRAREAYRKAREDLREEGYCMACGVYHRVGACAAVENARREARAAEQ